MVVGVEFAGDAPHPALLVGAGVGLAYVLFWVPTSCLATTIKGGNCLHNSLGLLGGCSQVRAHGVSNRAMILRVGARWREVLVRIGGSDRNKAATSGLVVSLGSMVYALTVTLI
jgi:hypothetical protein